MATIQTWALQNPHIVDFVSPLIGISMDEEIPAWELAKILYKHHEFMFAYEIVNTGLNDIRVQCSEKASTQLTDHEVLSDLVNVDEKTRQMCLKLKQLEGRLYVQMNAHNKALAIFKELASLGFNDEETLANLASCYKTQVLITHDKERRFFCLIESYILYRQAFECSPQSYWAGINAATLALLSGQFNAAKSYCQQVDDYCSKLALTQTKDYWLSATLAETKLINYLLISESGLDEALLESYRQAVALSDNFTQIASTRKNAKLLLSWEYPLTASLAVDEKQRKQVLEELLKILFTPPIIVFTGHMMDTAEREVPRFPQENEEAVKATLKDFVLKSKAMWGYGSAACGADILFLEVLQQLSFETNIILPYEQQAFIKNSVVRDNAVADKPSWEQRFHNLMDYTQAQIGGHLWNSSIQFLQGSTLYYRYANLVIHGLALIRAKQLGSKLLHLAVWNGEKVKDIGGTFDAIRWWQKDKEPIYYINPLHPETVQTFQMLEPIKEEDWNKPLAETEHGEIILKSIVFTDVAGYSQFTEEQILIFQSEVLKNIAELLEDHPSEPEVKNTWGDALYLIFSDLEYAGNFALALCELIEERNQTGYWAALGLPDPLQIRVALHFGPVFSVYDAILQKKTYAGNHVNNAARIEPITPAGEVYASAGAATFAEVLAIDSFACDYVGRVPLAKNYGVFPLFRVRRCH
ncbi:MAG: hypothetical protein GQ569_12815 [Methylococcaceae bacterium]|nr:hypothetical protein [Methylococcaceae bacterium]